MNENDLVRCLNCGEEFVTDQGRRCPTCYPQDHEPEVPESHMGTLDGHKVRCKCGLTFPANRHPAEPDLWESPQWEQHVVEASR